VEKDERKGQLGKIILKWIFKKGHGGIMDWTNLAQENRWRALANAIMNLRVPQNKGNFLTGRERVSFSERTLLLCGVSYVCGSVAFRKKTLKLS